MIRTKHDKFTGKDAINEYRARSNLNKMEACSTMPATKEAMSAIRFKKQCFPLFPNRAVYRNHAVQARNLTVTLSTKT